MSNNSDGLQAPEGSRRSGVWNGPPVPDQDRKVYANESVDQQQKNRYLSRFGARVPGALGSGGREPWPRRGMDPAPPG
jgi:hypothetical protein